MDHGLHANGEKSSRMHSEIPQTGSIECVWSSAAVVVWAEMAIRNIKLDFDELFVQHCQTRACQRKNVMKKE